MILLTLQQYHDCYCCNINIMTKFFSDIVDIATVSIVILLQCQHYDQVFQWYWWYCNKNNHDIVAMSTISLSFSFILLILQQYHDYYFCNINNMTKLSSKIDEIATIRRGFLLSDCWYCNNMTRIYHVLCFFFRHIVWFFCVEFLIRRSANFFSLKMILVAPYFFLIRLFVILLILWADDIATIRFMILQQYQQYQQYQQMAPQSDCVVILFNNTNNMTTTICTIWR